MLIEIIIDLNLIMMINKISNKKIKVYLMI
jgi:hypothetical protein